MSGYSAVFLGPNDNLEQWDRFVDVSPQGSVFCRSWWLRAVAPDKFRVLALMRNDAIVGGLPHVLSGGSIVMPPLTQTLGVLLPPAEQGAKYETNLSHELEIMRVIVKALPSRGNISMRCHYSLSNWLPFYWAGYRQTTRYTYVLEDLADTKRLFDEMSAQKRNKIRKAEKDGISVKESDDVNILAAMVHRTFSAQEMDVPYSGDILRRVCAAAFERNAGKMFVTYDGQGTTHSALLAIYDSSAMYNLVQGSDPGQSHPGACTLAQWKSIEYASLVTKRYDFEGSMIESIEHAFRSFGAVQKPYLVISRRSRTVEAAAALARLFRLR